MAKRRKPSVWDPLWYLKYPMDLREEFKKFHKANPEVYKEFKRVVFRTRDSGRKRYSAYTIFYVIRWRMDLKTTGPNFEINNDFIPLYVRTFIHNNREFLDFFELRKITSKGRKSEEERRRIMEEYGIDE